MKWDGLDIGKCRWCRSFVTVNENDFCRPCYEFAEDARGRIDQVWYYVVGFIDGATRDGPTDSSKMMEDCKAAAKREFGISEW